MVLENFKEEKDQSYSKDLKRTKGDVKKYFYSGDYYDLIGGTSTGAIIA